MTPRVNPGVTHPTRDLQQLRAARRFYAGFDDQTHRSAGATPEDTARYADGARATRHPSVDVTVDEGAKIGAVGRGRTHHHHETWKSNVHVAAESE